MQGRALAGNLAELQQENAGSAARLAALQRERDAARQELAETRSALADALEHLEGGDFEAQASRLQGSVSVVCSAHFLTCMYRTQFYKRYAPSGPELNPRWTTCGTACFGCDSHQVWTRLDWS